MIKVTGKKPAKKAVAPALPPPVSRDLGATLGDPFGAKGAQDSSKGVQWKQGVVIYLMSYISLLDNTPPIHCTPLPLHPPVMNTQAPRTPSMTRMPRRSRRPRSTLSARRPTARSGTRWGPLGRLARGRPRHSPSASPMRRTAPRTTSSAAPCSTASSSTSAASRPPHRYDYYYYHYT